jgi:5-methylcytosine-specific restriction enzyme subunit McrC
VSDRIPIANLYYLLSYAWDDFREGEEVDVSEDACPDLANLLARVLASGIRSLAHTGFERQYLPCREETPRLRGRILVAESYRRLTHRAGRMDCVFDELSTDTPANRILKGTANALLNLPGLTEENHQMVRIARDLLPDAKAIRVTGADFRRVQFHRNIRRYKLLLHVCELIHRSLLPEEHSGSRKFRDILRDETTMHSLFEHFVLHFARRHCQGAHVRAMPIGWQGEWPEEVNEILPGMITDVTIEWPHRKIILDCKFYKDALVSREGRLRMHSNHLYQLNAYLQNKARTPGWENVEGILLYPSVDHQVDAAMTLLGHSVRVVSIDLDRAWNAIHHSMADLFGVGSGVKADGFGK